MRCWPATCLRATCSSKRLLILTLHTENPTSTTLHSTMLPATRWHVYSGQDEAQTKSKQKGMTSTHNVHILSQDIFRQAAALFFSFRWKWGWFYRWGTNLWCFNLFYILKPLLNNFLVFAFLMWHPFRYQGPLHCKKPFLCFVPMFLSPICLSTKPSVSSF